ncbi:hypothetical protein F5Y19DRAFT_486801 [Xylariaceae sp. FL1651]|nr:hypothetical protein F5Y19DRAFT_486801 [Xylariaceae sp. FL1651]
MPTAYRVSPNPPASALFFLFFLSNTRRNVNNREKKSTRNRNHNGPLYLNDPNPGCSSTCPTCRRQPVSSVRHDLRPVVCHQRRSTAAAAAAAAHGDCEAPSEPEPEPRDTLLYGRRPEDYHPAPPRFFRDEREHAVRWVPTLPDGAAANLWAFGRGCNRERDGVRYKTSGGAVGTGGERRVFFGERG